MWIHCCTINESIDQCSSFIMILIVNSLLVESNLINNHLAVKKEHSERLNYAVIFTKSVLLSLFNL